MGSDSTPRVKRQDFIVLSDYEKAAFKATSDLMIRQRKGGDRLIGCLAITQQCQNCFILIVSHFLPLLSSCDVRPQKKASHLLAEVKHKSTVVFCTPAVWVTTATLQKHNCIFYFGHCDKLPNRENVNELLIRTNQRTAENNNVCN